VLPLTEFTVTTAAGRWAGSYGAVTSIDLSVDLGLATLTKALNGSGTSLGIPALDEIVKVPSKSWRVALGSDEVFEDTGLPVNPAVPYLYFIKTVDYPFDLGDNLSATYTLPKKEANQADSSAKKDLTSYHRTVTKGTEFLGYQLDEQKITWDNTGIHASGMLDTGIARAAISGEVLYDGTFELKGDGELDLGGFATGEAHFLLNNSGLQASASLDVLGSTIDIEGYLYSDGRFSLTGTGALNVAGFTLANASFAVNNSGLSVAGRVSVLGSEAALSGWVRSNGTFSFTGYANLSVGGFRLSSWRLDLSNAGMKASGRISALGANVELSGSVWSNGNFDVAGRARVGFGFIGGSAGFRMSSYGGSFSFTSSLSSSVSFWGVYGTAWMTFRIGVDSYGRLTYSGSGGASLSVPVAWWRVNVSTAISISNDWLGIQVPVLNAWAWARLPR
jgi:hypothetical protein